MSDTKFFRMGNSYLLGTDQPTSRFDKLPAGTYIIKYDQEKGFYFDIVPNFELPAKMYGNINKRAERILTTFADRPHTTGILLSGEKGSGKTLLTKTISQFARQRDIPTIIVNSPFVGDSFNTFLQKIEQPCILLFDEFEKVYDKDAQPHLLTLFDGVFTSKKMLLLTTNDFAAVNSHMKNRPGRLYYLLEFSGLDHAFVMEYGEENLKNRSHLKSLGVLATMVQPMSFDILQAVIEECNRYDETPLEALDMLNVKMSKTSDNYAVEFTSPSEIVKPGSVDNLAFCNPFHGYGVDYYELTGKTEENGDPEEIYKEIHFIPANLVSFKAAEGIFEFEKDGFKLKLVRAKEDKRTDFSKFSHLAY